MNIKWQVLILIFLVVGLIAVTLFVPKQLNADGSISTFKKKSKVSEPSAEVAEIIEE